MNRFNNPIQKHRVFGWLGGVALAIALFYYIPIVLQNADHRQPVTDKPGANPRAHLSSSNDHFMAMPTAPEALDLEAERRKELFALGKEDIDRAVAFINQNYPSSDRQGMLRILMVELGNVDLNVLLRVGALFDSQTDRTMAIGMIARHWADQDIGKFREFVKAQLTGSLKNDTYFAFTTALANKGLFDEAVRTIDEMPFSELRSRAIGTVASLMAASDSPKAIQWAANLSRREDQQVAQRSVLSTLAHNGDIDGLKSFLDSAPESLRSRIERELGRTAGKSGALPVEQGRGAPSDEALQMIGAMETLPQAALPAIGAKLLSIGDPALRDEATVKYVGRLFDLSSAQAVDWINSCPPETRDVAISGLVSKWYQTDSEQLSDWINQLPAGHNRDTALKTLVYQIKRSDPNAARQAASTVSDELLRNQLLKSIDGGR